MTGPKKTGAGKNRWLERRIISYAHQGGAWEGPSSTLFTIRQALQAGATGIELDVHATSDRHLVVCHDTSVDRTTNGSGEISEMTLADLRELDNAYWWVPGADVAPGLAPSDYPYRGRAPKDRDFGIATLSEALELVDEFPGVVVNLDIKRTEPTVNPYEELLARELESHGRIEDVIVASFLDKATETFRKVAPEIDTSAGTIASADFWRAIHSGETPPSVPYVALQIPLEHAGMVVVDEVLIAAAHAQAIAVHVWTIDDAEIMTRLIDLGVDGIITDLPKTLCGLLEERGVAWRPKASG
jgi:glycerophosphoryl diester phosphodiesterase